MQYFVSPTSIVRRIWGSSDTVLFIFAGAAAEFALNKSVDWLYFTGRLPADPLARLFSTVDYARRIVFAEQAGAEKAIDSMAAIHDAVEKKRGQAIPAWAYRDVLFMLIGYSIRAFEALERPLTEAEKEEITAVFGRVGRRMGIPDVPTSYPAWQQARAAHMATNLAPSRYTTDLYRQYRKHLGGPRYWLLLRVQGLIVPSLVAQRLHLPAGTVAGVALALYRLVKRWPLSQWAKRAMLPTEYQDRILALDAAPVLTPTAARPALPRCPMHHAPGGPAPKAARVLSWPEPTSLENYAGS